MSDNRSWVEAGFLIAVCVVAVVALAVPLVVGGSSPAEPTATIAVETDVAATGVTAPESAGSATVDGETYDTARSAVAAAEPGQTVVLDGRFDERITVSADDVSLVAADGGAVLDGGGEGRVLTVDGDNVTVTGLWVRGSGSDLGAEDAGVFVAGNEARIETVRVTDSAYGIWLDSVDGTVIEDVRIDGREHVFPVTERGNGVHLYESGGTVIRDSEIVAVRDGIYFSWSTGVLAANNTIRDSRYGVHYMYSDHNRLVDNVAADNGVGYALMVSEGLTVANNTAVRNDDTSGHGILAKDIERSKITGNAVVDNANGLYVYNAQDNDLTDNLVFGNDVGIHSSAGSEGQLVAGNTFVANAHAVSTPRNSLVSWNDTDRGNYWSGARTVDRTGDGVSEIRHRPSGLVEHLVAEHPQAAVFANSPSFEAVRLAEDSFPVIESPGVVDRRPLVDPPHDWRNGTGVTRGIEREGRADTSTEPTLAGSAEPSEPAELAESAESEDHEP
ncbi:nitrous oxide reductase family maturation protein NosD [Halorubrum sp. JWXQ-INN 858]|uniref:nitrous oxide reductase family maturation protein NosD n=1 Tax=Halorubrum sp. JWXQ-INN 858 TaxID=2690782 RepID=UPI001356ACEC|nr:nitrous oxide reductase family maturation protein NosD [Halorubrum sp. JWXQ-INN 858]MWV65377.1 nitrous oxide reductase family maturation protein NosD [Halorubrum sp. JWXQ-INN 858]